MRETSLCSLFLYFFNLFFWLCYFSSQAALLLNHHSLPTLSSLLSRDHRVSVLLHLQKTFLVFHHSLPWRDAQSRCFLFKPLETCQLHRCLRIEPLGYNRLNLNFDPCPWRKMPHTSSPLMSGSACPLSEHLSLGVVLAFRLILPPQHRTCSNCHPLRGKALVTLNPEFWNREKTRLTQHLTDVSRDMVKLDRVQTKTSTLTNYWW